MSRLNEASGKARDASKDNAEFRSLVESCFQLSLEESRVETALGDTGDCANRLFFWLAVARNVGACYALGAVNGKILGTSPRCWSVLVTSSIAN